MPDEGAPQAFGRAKGATLRNRFDRQLGLFEFAPRGFQTYLFDITTQCHADGRPELPHKGSRAYQGAVCQCVDRQVCFTIVEQPQLQLLPSAILERLCLELTAESRSAAGTFPIVPPINLS